MSAPRQLSTVTSLLSSASTGTIWIFGYGSLTYRPGFEHARKVQGYIKDFKRVWHQGSTDHRGTEEYPGRTVTLERVPGAITWGVAYELAGDAATQEATLAYLEWREKQYDVRELVDVYGTLDQLPLLQQDTADSWSDTDGFTAMNAATPAPAAVNRPLPPQQHPQPEDANPQLASSNGSHQRPNITALVDNPEDSHGVGDTVLAEEQVGPGSLMTVQGEACLDAQQWGAGHWGKRPDVNGRATPLHALGVDNDNREDVKTSITRATQPLQRQQGEPGPVQGTGLLLSNVLCYVASSDVSRNRNWLGPASEEELVHQMATAVGPSGPNWEYVIRLADTMRQMGAVDEELFSIEAKLKKVLAERRQTAALN